MGYLGLTFVYQRWLGVGIRFMVIWLATGLTAWWLLPRLFWVSFQGLMLLQLVILSYFMAWSMQFNPGRASARHVIIIGSLAAPFGLLFDLAVLNIYMMNNRTPAPSAQSVLSGGIMALLAPFVIGGLILVLGASGSVLGVLFARLPRPHKLGLLGLIVLILIVRAFMDENGFGSTRLSEQDAGRTIEVRSNTQFDIVLNGYPNQGCEWEWIEGDWNVVGGGASKYRQDWSGGGQTWFHAWANSPGRSPIRIVYRCGPNAPPLKIFEVEILVQ